MRSARGHTHTRIHTETDKLAQLQYLLPPLRVITNISFKESYVHSLMVLCHTVGLFGRLITDSFDSTCDDDHAFRLICGLWYSNLVLFEFHVLNLLHLPSDSASWVNCYC